MENFNAKSAESPVENRVDVFINGGINKCWVLYMLEAANVDSCQLVRFLRF